jgi:ubiquinone/menaquinone biosynthesis C-methylase UbiE
MRETRDHRRTQLEETVYRLDGPLRWAMGENRELVTSVGVRPGQRVLDVGAGTGYLSLPLAEAVGAEGRIDCIDLSGELLDVLAAKAARRRLAPRLHGTIAHACDLPFVDETFDFVFSSYLLHELGDLAAEAIGEMGRVLRVGGRVILADFMRLKDAQLNDEIEAWYAAQQDGAGPGEVHLRFDREDIERMLARAGLQQERSSIWHVFHMHIIGRKS